MAKTALVKDGGIFSFAEETRGKNKGRVKTGILERWNTRVVPRGLDRLGRNGANLYIQSYGKGIAAAKVAELALCAEAQGAGEMAAGFWESAYFLATGREEVYSGSEDKRCITSENLAKVRAGEPRQLDGFPDHVQPGGVHTMQPVDSSDGRERYINDPTYYGQPKRDGIRNVLFSCAGGCVHQSRSTSVLPNIGGGFEKAAMDAAAQFGPFVLDGERYYLSHRGSEHRTAAQAATVNVDEGQGDVQPVVVYAVFKALYADGHDLRAGGEDARLRHGTEIGEMLASKVGLGNVRVEVVPTAKTKKKKTELANSQAKEGREGEVWTRRDAPYTGGKGHRGDAVRTKYLMEDTFTVIGVSEDSSARGFSSIEVADRTGKTVGSVGTGFDADTGRRLLEAHKKNPGKVQILVRYQGTTEQGKLWHARFLEIDGISSSGRLKKH